MSEKISLRNRFIQTILRIDKEMTWYIDPHINLSEPEYVSDIEYFLKQKECLKI